MFVNSICVSFKFTYMFSIYIYICSGAVMARIVKAVDGVERSGLQVPGQAPSPRTSKTAKRSLPGGSGFKPQVKD